MRAINGRRFVKRWIRPADPNRLFFPNSLTVEFMRNYIGACGRTFSLCNTDSLRSTEVYFDPLV